jgi:hypothetical protein
MLRQVHLLSRPRTAGHAYRGHTASEKSESPPTVMLMLPRRGRRIASLSLAAAAGVVLGTAALAPAMASTIAETSSGANIVQQADNGSLIRRGAVPGR